MNVTYTIYLNPEHDFDLVRGGIEKMLTYMDIDDPVFSSVDGNLVVSFITYCDICERHIEEDISELFEFEKKLG